MCSECGEFVELDCAAKFESDRLTVILRQNWLKLPVFAGVLLAPLVATRSLPVG
jgi:hypothetical protein